MTGRASKLTLKLGLHHNELKNVSHVVLRGALVEVSGIKILFHWIGPKSWSRNMWNTTLYVHYLLRYKGAADSVTVFKKIVLIKNIGLLVDRKETQKDPLHRWAQ